MVAVKSLIGEKFFRLLVIARDANDKRGGTTWRCQCECGAIKTVGSQPLQRGMTRSCGCFKSEVMSRKMTRGVKHGMSRTKIYRTRAGMIGRCSDENHPQYHNYGGRGISVCKRWLESVEDFIADVGLSPFPGAQIDRIDVNGNYEPENVRWVSSKVNNRNKRNNRIIEYKGVQYPLSELAEQYGLTYALLSTRIASHWPLEAALTIPKGGRYRAPGRRHKIQPESNHV